MEWLKRLSGQTLGLDTAPLIYFIERNPLYYSLVEPFYAAVERQRGNPNDFAFIHLKAESISCAQ